MTNTVSRVVPGAALLCLLVPMAGCLDTSVSSWAGDDKSSNHYDCWGEGDTGTLTSDDLLLLIDKQTEDQLASSYVPEDLVVIPAGMIMSSRRGRMARLPAVRAFAAMQSAAREEGHDIIIRSAYRDYAIQCTLFNGSIDRNGLEHAQLYSALPGRSEHQLGTALDITSPSANYELNEYLADTAAGQWMAENASNFGLVMTYPEGQEEYTGYGFEPWHFRYIGRAAAIEASGYSETDPRYSLSTPEPWKYLRACAAGGDDIECPREQPGEQLSDFVGGTCYLGDFWPLLDDGICEQEYPDGHVTVACDRFCPDGPGGLFPTTFCVGTPARDERGVCHSRCATDVSCRDDYVCIEAARPAPYDDVVTSVCLPACDEWTASCALGFECSEGACQPAA